jgi:hypothetical protein
MKFQYGHSTWLFGDPVEKAEEKDVANRRDYGRSSSEESDGHQQRRSYGCPEQQHGVRTDRFDHGIREKAPGISPGPGLELGQEKEHGARIEKENVCAEDDAE